MTKTLKTPAQWMAEEGTNVVNYHVWEEDGRDQFTPIDKETYQETVRTLTRAFGLKPIPTTVGRDRLIEQIQTKIEEFRENIQAEINDMGGRVFSEDHQFDIGAIHGLTLALDLVNDAE